MTTQDENTLKPASATTPDPSAVNASADIAGLDKQSQDGDDSNLSLSKCNPTLSTGDDVVIELPPTAKPPTAKPLTEGRDGNDDALSLSKLRSTVSTGDDAVVKPPLTAEPPTEGGGDGDDALRPNKESKLMNQHNGDEDCKSPSATELKPPAVNDFKDFTICNEVDELDDTDECVSTYTLVMIVDQDNYSAWIGTVNAPRDQVSLEQAVNCLSRIPDEAIYPPVTPGMQAIATCNFILDEDTWLKRPLIHAYSEKDPTNWTANVFLSEIKAHQLVEEHPHRSLVKFKACLEKDGLVVGILQKRYPTALNFRVEARSQPPYDATAFYKDIEAGLRHLHSLGFAHNDLNPSNVMVDAEDRPIIIDLGAARPLGQVLHQGGTPGWCDGYQMTSSVANDEIGLRLMKEYLQEHQKKKIIFPRETRTQNSPPPIMASSTDPKAEQDKPLEQKTEQKPATLGEDDEFEDFPVDDWPEDQTEASKNNGETKHLWEESWDDDDTSDDFSTQLKEELKKVEELKRR